MMAQPRRSIRVLFVTPYVPSRLRTRSFNLITHLARSGHRPTVFALATSAEDQASAAELEGYCEEVQIVRVPAARSVWNCIRALGTGDSFQAQYYYSPIMDRLIRNSIVRNGFLPHGAAAAASESYDVLHIEHLRAALFGLNATGIPRVYDSVDCISHLLGQTVQMTTSSWARLTARADMQRTQRFEGPLVGQFDRVLITSEAEKRALLTIANGSLGRAQYAEDTATGNVSVLPNGVDLEYFLPSCLPRDPATLLYVGRMSYHANATAVQQLVRQIMPIVWSRRPETQLVIVGPDPPRAIRAIARQYPSRVTVTGYVSDIRSHLGRATVSVSPLVYGVGVQNKVLEAMATATPVVATPVSCSALSTAHEEHVLFASKPDDFAAQVVRLLNDQSLRGRIGDAGRRYVEEFHSWHSIARRLVEIYGETIQRVQRYDGATEAGH